jgi:hypothetical protein
MLIAAFNRKNMVTPVSFTWVFIGALFFVFSDSCIAINLFYKPFASARAVIMSTYIMAQFLIISGVLKQILTRQQILIFLKSALSIHFIAYNLFVHTGGNSDT